MDRPSASPPPRRRVVIVDADRRVRRDMADLVSLEAGVDVVGVAGGVAEALDAVLEADPDVILLDPRLPEVDAGLALVAEVRRAAPRTLIVVMSCVGAIEDPALAQGAHAFIPKSGIAPGLVEALLAQPGTLAPALGEQAQVAPDQAKTASNQEEQP